MRARLLPVLACVVLAACGSSTASHARRQPSPAPSPTPTAQPARADAPAADWPMFGYDAARTNAAPQGIPRSQVGSLTVHRVALDGTVDSSPIFLHGIGGRDLIVVTTTYGRTEALDATSGSVVWRFTPSSYGHVAGTSQLTNATPVADPNRKAVYAASPDGVIHKLRLSDGHEIRHGGWPVSVTRDATHEKIAPALNVDGRYVLVTTGGYLGDAPPYQGKIVAIDRSSGRIVNVINTLCSDRHTIFAPSSCPASDSAIWGRAGAVVDPNTHRVYVTTGNAPFNGSNDWGDSVLELSPGAASLLRHYTPSNQAQLASTDADLGSTSPALLPDSSGRTAYLLQGGKDNALRLLSLSSSLSSVQGAAGSRLGGEVQTLPQPGGDIVIAQPAVRRAGGHTEAFVTTNSGTAAYRLSGGRLHRMWSNSTGGTSPILAGALLWVYDPGGSLNVYDPATGRVVRSFSVPSGHWNSPIVSGGRVYLPTGDANSHSTSGQLVIVGP